MSLIVNMSCPKSCLSQLWMSPTKNRVDPVESGVNIGDGAQVLLAWGNRSVNLVLTMNTKS